MHSIHAVTLKANEIVDAGLGPSKCITVSNSPLRFTYNFINVSTLTRKSEKDTSIPNWGYYHMIATLKKKGSKKKNKIFKFY